MKRMVAVFLMVTLMIARSYASATYETEATDVSGTPTQDEVLSISAVWQDGKGTPYDLQAAPSDQLTMDTVTSAFKHVHENKQDPVSFFPEETQQQIKSMMQGSSASSLFITEMMRMSAPSANVNANLEVTMLMDVDYQPGQLIIVVLASAEDPNNQVWTPIKGEVLELGKVRFVIPQADAMRLAGGDLLFSLLTDRKAVRGGVIVSREEREHIALPSKSAYDIIRIIKVFVPDGSLKKNNYGLEKAPETKAISDELKLIRNHVSVLGQPFCTWLSEESQNEIQQLLGNQADKNNLVVYDYCPLLSRDYHETDGDVAAIMSFATPYVPGRQVVAVLGLPPKAAPVDNERSLVWAVQRAQVRNTGEVEVVFDQLVMFDMVKETGLLIILSEPLVDK